MSETVQIIATITGAILAVGVVAKAFGGMATSFSKSTSAIKALNKLLADRHKRAMEAKSKATDQKNSATASQAIESTSRPDGGASRDLPAMPPKPKFPKWSILFSALLFTSLFLGMFSSSPVDQSTVAMYTIIGTGIVLMVLISLGELAFDYIFVLLDLVLRLQTISLDYHKMSLEYQVEVWCIQHGVPYEKLLAARSRAENPDQLQNPPPN